MSGDKHSPSAAEAAPGVVRAGEVYRLKELCRRLHWREHSLRQARLAGLRIIRFGREAYILGDDALDFFRRIGDEQEPREPTARRLTVAVHRNGDAASAA